MTIDDILALAERLDWPSVFWLERSGDRSLRQGFDPSALTVGVNGAERD